MQNKIFFSKIMKKTFFSPPALIFARKKSVLFKRFISIAIYSHIFAHHISNTKMESVRVYTEGFSLYHFLYIDIISSDFQKKRSFIFVEWLYYGYVKALYLYDLKHLFF